MDTYSQDVFSAMHAGETPLARYAKTIVGKVHVVALNPFDDKPEGILLSGNGDESYIDLWTPKAVVFFEKVNKEHINKGRVTKTNLVPKEQQSPNILTDEEVDTLLTSPFMTLKRRVEKFTAPGPVFRLINRARDLEKSAKIIKYLESKAAEIELEKLGE